METLLSCHSPSDVLICYICSLRQQTSEIRKSSPGAGYMGIVLLMFLESSNFPPDIALNTLHCEMMVILNDSTRSSMDVCRAEG